MGKPESPAGPRFREDDAMDARRMVIIGAGGFAREVRWLAEEITAAGGDRYEFTGYVVSEPDKPGPTDSADEILGDFDWLRAHRDRWDCLAMGIGNAAPRLKVLGHSEIPDTHSIRIGSIIGSAA